MQIIKKKENIGNILFFIGIILELLIMMTDHSQITLPLRGRVSHLAFVLFGCKILTTDYSKREWTIIFLFAILGAVSYFTCKDEYVIRAVMMVVSAKNVNTEKVAKATFFAALAGTTLIVLLSLTGVLGTTVDIRDYGRGLVEARWCLGFSHANNVHDMFWYLLSFFFLLNNKNCSWKHYSFFTAANIALYFLTISRTGVIVAQVIILAAALFHYMPRFNQKMWIYLLSIFGVMATMFLTLLGGLYGVKNPLVRFFNRLFTERLQMVYEHAPVSKWTLFPQPNSMQCVDNGIAWLFYGYGIVVGVAYLAIIIALIYRMYQKRDGMALAILVTAVLVTFMEATFIFNTSLLCNPIFFLLFNEWYHLGTNDSK